ncbi:MAG TPA: hypothetical protein VGP61_12380 [Gemmatimonadales bacterium]|nr:hypothetical protein [Gemmatimonadales bacterium]
MRFVRFRLERLPSSECRARVTLAWPDGARFRGEARGLTSQAGELRCAAQACLQALTQAIREPAFELVGVKTLHAFDATVVIVSLATSARGAGPRVVGICLRESDPPRGAALAVLNATNRLLGRLVPPSPREGATQGVLPASE